jgi:hypothetical protein
VAQTPDSELVLLCGVVKNTSWLKPSVPDIVRFVVQGVKMDVDGFIEVSQVLLRKL